MPQFNLLIRHREKIDELIKKKISLEDKIEPINLINDEIKTKKNNFEKYLTLKHKKRRE